MKKLFVLAASVAALSSISAREQLDHTSNRVSLNLGYSSVSAPSIEGFAVHHHGMHTTAWSKEGRKTGNGFYGRISFGKDTHVPGTNTVIGYDLFVDMQATKAKIGKVVTASHTDHKDKYTGDDAYFKTAAVASYEPGLGLGMGFSMGHAFAGDMVVYLGMDTRLGFGKVNVENAAYKEVGSSKIRTLDLCPKIGLRHRVHPDMSWNLEVRQDYTVAYLKGHSALQALKDKPTNFVVTAGVSYQV